jgi:putative aldouronate transport system substrate-binding protein
MRKTARMLAILFAAIMVAGTAAACGTPPAQTPAPTAAPTAAGTDATEAPFDPMAKYDPGITLTLAGSEYDPNEGYPEGITAENNPWKTAYKDILGITFENKWTVPADKFTEKLNTQIAAGDVPDILNGLSAVQFDQLKKLGLATPMEDYIDKYATDLCKQGLSSDGGYSLLYCKGGDGHTYALPHTYGYTDNVCEMWIRSDWLKKLNLQAPKTTDELYSMLKAFSTADFNGDGTPDNTLGIITPNDLWAIGSVFNSFGSQPFWSWYKDDTGKLVYSTVYKPEATEQALDFLQKLYKEGLMDQEFGTANYDKYNEYLASGKAGVSFMPWWYADTFVNTVKNDPAADWDAYPIPTGMGEGTIAKPFAYYGPAAYNVISVKCEHPEAAVKLLNLFVDKVYGPGASENFSSYVRADNGYNMTWLAVVGLSWANKIDSFQNVAAAVEKKDPAGLNSEEKTYYDSCIQYLDGNKDLWATYKKYGPNNAMITVVDYYNKSATPLFANYYGPSTDAVKQYQSSLDAKWLSVCVEIIMGQKPASAYGDFVTEWYSLGGDKMEKEINDYATAHPDIVK